MAKQVFEFTDLEVMQILANHLVSDGKIKAGKTQAKMEIQPHGWGKEGFNVQIKIGE